MWLTAVSFVVQADENQPISETPNVFKASETPYQDVQKALTAARLANKKLLVIMGAQWCHDSRGLAKQFATPQMTNILNDYYQTIYLDVGYFNDLRPITQRFGQAHYFATPTVMIIDAESEKLINADSMQIWGAADSLPLSKYEAYFSTYGQQTIFTQEHVPEHHAQLIEVFKQQQANRLTNAYQLLVPAMVKEDATGEYDEDFMIKWREIRTYRTSLQEDIQALYQQAIASPDKSITLPEYPAFSWE